MKNIGRVVLVLFLASYVLVGLGMQLYWFVEPQDGYSVATITSFGSTLLINIGLLSCVLVVAEILCGHLTNYWPRFWKIFSLIYFIVAVVQISSPVQEMAKEGNFHGVILLGYSLAFLPSLFASVYLGWFFSPRRDT